jgi:antitoxin (DNA-binding transcriptional repressor) of toxin-antitoxin stability system
MFLAGRTAEVAAVLQDVDGGHQVAVTVDGDPAAELHGWYGRFHYFRPHEIQPLEAAGEEGRDGCRRPADT